MKRTLPLLLSVIIALFFLPLSTGFASPREGPAGDPAVNFAPGSIVRFEHLSIEDVHEFGPLTIAAPIRFQTGLAVWSAH